MNHAQRIAVVGGGMTGLTAALELARHEHVVEIYEARDHVGGLSDAYSWNGITWDRFYHVVLSTDEHLLSLIDELELSGDLFWTSTKSGFYGDGKLVSMSSMGDFVTFPFLSLWEKFRLGLGILTSIRLHDADKLDRIYVREWLTRVFGRRVYEQIWDPLLRSKFGEARHETSAAFIWATIKRLYGARSGEAKTERMGHVNGGYSMILARLRDRLRGMGVTIRTASPVNEVVSNGRPAGGSSPGTQVIVRNGTESVSYDKVLLTVPAPEVLRLTARSGSDGAYWQAVEDVHYLGVLCLFVVLDRALSPYYVTNLLDRTLPFTGIIEVTNVVDSESFGDRHLVYLPKYVTRDDPLVAQSDQEIAEAFVSALRRVHPELQEDCILHTRLFRERYVQPLQEVNYLDCDRGIRTPIPGIYLANSTMLYNSTLNNNAAVALAKRAASAMMSSAETAPSRETATLSQSDAT